MLKKILAFLAAAALALTLTGCGGTTVTLPTLTLSASSGSSDTGEITREKPDGTYEDTLVGLMSYMEDGQAVVKDEGVSFDNDSIVIDEDVTTFTQMSYKEIGAVNGYRYQFSFNGSTVQAEFYEFDPDNLDEKAKTCVSSVRENGFFQMLDEEVQAVLHPSGKYLMIYTDSNAEKKDENKEQKAWAEELFLGFQT